MDTNNNQKILQLEGYRILVDFHKWSYDTCMRDFKFFLAIEGVLAGFLLNALYSASENSFSNHLALLGACLVGVLVAIVWVSRQWRAIEFAREREKELREMEKKIGNEFLEYFSRIQKQTKESAESMGDRFLPLFGRKLKAIPNVMRTRPFLRCFHIQQALIFIWLLIIIMIFVRL